ncbi:hypothetical protein HS088_TW19G00800 [Tripterygium wilfordii]|uniref:HMA domain-containing protein n=1 Tax=Tripterygium wilfordii TaxID=458696 RepID=A0A7J7CB93_TRIWF|nr:heavy metal-associated isoprenylated plant protein 39-like [Tripterygium wilfordii]KAF5731195.1 hypothetical protein HS088_TW19G00800 [Tripterygium wilfordii]
MSKKMVLKLELHDERARQKAMIHVTRLSGIDSISIDMKDKKLTLTGDVDPVIVVKKLKKVCYASIISVGPKEAEKKKEEPKKTEEKKKDSDDVSELVKAYKAYNPHMTTYYHVRSAEEDPNACVIC